MRALPILRSALVSAALCTATFAPEDYVMDLGSGDERTVIAAARRDYTGRLNGGRLELR